jgi:hypothetical protein
MEHTEGKRKKANLRMLVHLQQGLSMRRPVGQLSAKLPKWGVTPLSRRNVDFFEAKPVISAAQKFIIPVAALDDAYPLIYPSGTKNAGQPIVDWQGKPVGDKGIIFFNEIDKCYQAASANGRSVIIINEVTSNQARTLEEFISNLHNRIDSLSKSSLESLLEYARSQLGLADIYNSTDDFILSKMQSVDGARATEGGRPSGWMRRKDLDICLAVFVKGPARFKGPAATPQEIPIHGAFIVRQGSDYRMVDVAVMLRTYMNPDCSPLSLRQFMFESNAGF